MNDRFSRAAWRGTLQQGGKLERSDEFAYLESTN